MLMVNQLVGFGSAVVAARRLEFLDSATSTAATITCPAGVIAGDLLVLYDVAYRGSGILPTLVTPTGFTSITNDTGLSNDTRFNTSYKIAIGTEGGTSITGMNALNNNDKMLVAFRPTTPIASVAVGSTAFQKTANDPTAQVVTSAGGTPPLVVFGQYSTWNATLSPRSFTPSKDSEISSISNAVRFNNWLAWKIYNSGLQNVTVDMDDEGVENYLGSFYLACTLS